MSTSTCIRLPAGASHSRTTGSTLGLRGLALRRSLFVLRLLNRFHFVTIAQIDIVFTEQVREGGTSAPVEFLPILRLVGGEPGFGLHRQIYRVIDGGFSVCGRAILAELEPGLVCLELSCELIDLSLPRKRALLWSLGLGCPGIDRGLDATFFRFQYRLA